MRLAALVLAVTASACFFKPDPPSGTVPPGGGSGASVQFAVGDHHACLIDTVKQLWCWGDNRFGQLGVTTTDPYSGSPMPVEVGTMWKSIAAGRAHTCGLTTDNAIYCWGANDGRQVDGSPPATKLGITPVDLGDPNVTANQIFAGGDASCATTTNGALFCWGRYQPPSPVGYKPTPVAPGSMLADPPHQGWEQVAMADTHICALNDFGNATCWGDDTRLQLGDPSNNNHDVLTAYVNPQRMQFIAAGSLGTCGIGIDGTFVCWGQSNITNTNADSPQSVIDTRGDWKMLGVGLDHVCGIRGAEGNVQCYGGDDTSQLGDDFQNVSQFHPDSPVFTGASEIYASRGWTCARKPDGATYCWGSNQYGEAGNGKVSTAHHPYATISGKGMIENVATGPLHACAVLTSGEVDCWGWNPYNQIKTDAQEFFTTPTDTGKTAVAVATPPPGARLVTAGFGHTCIREPNNMLECWGLNGDGQLGDTTGPFTPTSVGISQPVWIDFSAGGNSTCATVGPDSNSGEVWCWGARGGTNGVPKMVKAGVMGVAVGDLEAVFAGGPAPATAVTMSDTGVGCFDMATPVAATTMGPVRQVAMSMQGDGHACAESNDGVSASTLYCWGDNGHDQVTSSGSGCVEPTAVKFPGTVQVHDWNGAVRPSIVSVGGNHSCAIAENPDKLYCWGDNTTEAVGETSFGVDTVPSPALATTVSTEWYEVATAATYTCAITKDQLTLYCWGLNELGQIGNGDRFPSAPPTDPVHIPTPGM